MFPYCICMGMINILNERCSKIFNKILKINEGKNERLH